MRGESKLGDLSLGGPELGKLHQIASAIHDRFSSKHQQFMSSSLTYVFISFRLIQADRPCHCNPYVRMSGVSTEKLSCEEPVKKLAMSRAKQSEKPKKTRKTTLKNTPTEEMQPGPASVAKSFHWADTYFNKLSQNMFGVNFLTILIATVQAGIYVNTDYSGLGTVVGNVCWQGYHAPHCTHPFIH